MFVLILVAPLYVCLQLIYTLGNKGKEEEINNHFLFYKFFTLFYKNAKRKNLKIIFYSFTINVCRIIFVLQLVRSENPMPVSLNRPSLPPANEVARS